MAFTVISILLFSVIISQIKQCLTIYVNLFQFIYHLQVKILQNQMSGH